MIVGGGRAATVVGAACKFDDSLGSVAAAIMGQLVAGRRTKRVIDTGVEVSERFENALAFQSLGERLGHGRV